MPKEKTIHFAPCYKDLKTQKIKNRKEKKIMTINEIKNENGMLYLNIAICDRDFHNHFIRCADCDTIVFKGDAVEISDDYYCSDCITTCCCCGTIVPKSEVYTVADSGGEYSSTEAPPMQ